MSHYDHIRLHVR